MTSLIKLLDQAALELDNIGALYAVAGGLAANIYRASPRATLDVDFAILTETEAGKTAHKIISNLGFHATALRKAQLDGGPSCHQESVDSLSSGGGENPWKS